MAVMGFQHVRERAHVRRQDELMHAFLQLKPRINMPQRVDGALVSMAVSLHASGL